MPLVVGIGLRPGCGADAVRALLERVAAESGLDLSGADVATLDRRAGEPGLRAAVAPRVPRGYPAAELARVAVPHPSERVAAATGTPAVAEAAALHAAGPGAVLVVAKTAGAGVTVAVARSGVGLDSVGRSRPDRSLSSTVAARREPGARTGGDPPGEERR